MKKFQLSDYKKGVVFSLFLHAVLLFAIFYEYKEETKAATLPQQKAHTISLSSFTMPTELPKVAKPIEKPVLKKPVCKKKPTEKKKKLAKQKTDHKKYKKNMKRKEFVQKEKIEKQKPEPKEEIKEVAEVTPPEKQIEKEEKEVQKVAEVTPEKKTPVEEIKEVAQTTQTQQAVTKKESQQISAASLEKEFVATNFEIIRALILENLKYPYMAKRMNQTGIVKLMLVINPHGKLINVSLEDSSGHKLLDKSALKAANYLAEMTLPVPKATSRIILPVTFALN